MCLEILCVLVGMNPDASRGSSFGINLSAGAISAPDKAIYRKLEAYVECAACGLIEFFDPAER